MKGVAITGMGIISAIGNSVEENYASLLNNKTAITTIENISTVHANLRKVGEIKKTNQELADELKLSTDNNFSRTAMIGAIAAKQAVANARITSINEYKTGLISATSVGGMDMTERYYYDYFEKPETIKYISCHDGGDVAQKIANELGLNGMVTTISTACSSAANAIMLGARLIKSGKLDRVIVGGTDALAKFTINGFKTLMILSDGYNMPFDNDRKGLNLGEAAAFLVLESDEMVAKQNKKVLARVSGYANANDAFHQTASSENGEGAFLAMEKAFQVSGLKPAQINYINVHGTATPNNDLSEGRAIVRVFGENNIPDFSSTKPFTGHTLAAAAAIEAVYSVLAIQNNVVFPNLNFKTPMEEFNMMPQTILKHKNIEHVLSNSFGFGGNCSTIIFSKSE
ncbi:beta-ketoacyl-[acyl-carrier-protein] synthase family protein [Flavobacterium psychrophilum]|uniref:Beta-ketoacyl-[acyl-carrier-protein] synthase family protein n=1 Tax=Flavobacterium psychrophilum TaxID=96345 RepID=A0A7U2NJ54_FLAPS|nr:beta-ketoacyl-[acyl-carrier-protein] synthase family protein [Flavobacterium psychrophilum]EKT2070857.1 beta-ketoacyl-[acyl-carrier-protein] synthase family protein [Flavobacterium psychrophilum]EKT4490377.1 beta-ketoacyl-[acyl-carrier-protein] synthase family protein [Flavobacterium psychrophilum]EKT4549701.1 beta-ketoacyl-[acyl-carrier-protein] synthase family protein [Flavobacterium psychrophilum]EKT4551333.1 beta-ketoacyl-[acyl-carrier-protein] synthase family protein [Flavobacterium psy